MRKALLVAALLVVMHFGFLARAKVGDIPLEFDSANYALIATRMLGGEPYLASYNNKPPGIYWLYEASLALTGRSALACKIPTLACDGLSLFLILFLARRLLPRPGSLVTLAIYSTLYLPATLAPHGFAEFPVTLFELAGLAAIVPGRGEDAFRLTPSRCLALGIALGIATLFKQPALFVLAGAIAFSLWAGGERRWGSAGAILLGWVAVVGGLLAWLAAEGSLGRFWDLVVASGVAHGYAGGFTWDEKASKMAEVTLRQMPLFSLFALLVLVRAVRRRRPLDRLLLCLALPILLMAAGAYEFYGHYLLPALPLLCLALAGWAVEGGRGARVAVGILLAFQAVALAGYLFGARVPGDLPGPFGRVVDAWKETWKPRPLSLAYQMRAADYVREHLRPGEKLISTNADIPFLAGVENAYRFVCVAPIFRSVEGGSLGDFPEYASRARFFWAEKWRLALLPAQFVARIADGAGWRKIEEVEHEEFSLYENLALGPS